MQVNSIPTLGSKSGRVAFAISSDGRSSQSSTDFLDPNSDTLTTPHHMNERRMLVIADETIVVLSDSFRLAASLTRSSIPINVLLLPRLQAALQVLSGRPFSVNDLQSFQKAIAVKFQRKVSQDRFESLTRGVQKATQAIRLAQIEYTVSGLFGFVIGAD